MAVFKKNGSYSPIFRHISEVSGEDMVDKVCREANENYYRMLKAHDDLNNAAMMHWKQCCERAAIYVVVKKYYPDSVTEWFDEALREYGVKAGAALNRLLHFPGMKALFLPFMRKIAKNIFGPKGGFKNTFGVVNKDETHFDILDCPYCRYLQELNCPELKPDILITSGDIIAFGDDYADIGMLKLAGVGVAMGNAIAEVKAVADIVIGTNDEDGIAEYLGGLV